MPGPVLVPFTDRAQLVVRPGMTGATCNIYTGMHDLAEMAFTAHLLRPSDLFGDVGANVGVYTVLAGAVAGARCIAFEPAPETTRHLRANVIVNALAAEIVEAAVGRSPGRIHFSIGHDTVNHVASSDERGVEVPVVTLDDYVRGATLLKIDVEGFEREVLEGASEVLADNRLLAVIMETNGSGEAYGTSDNELATIMSQAGFACYTYNPFQRRLEAGSPEKNGIFVRDVDAVASRLREAPSFTVLGTTL